MSAGARVLRAGVLLLAGCLLTVAGLAQAPGAAPVRFSLFALRPLSGVGFVPRAGAPAEKVTLNPTARSPRYEYRGAQPLRLVDVATGKAVAEATIPSGLKEVLLVLMPVDAAAAARTGLPYQVAVMDDGWSRLGAGGLGIVNLSGLALSGRVGAENVSLQAGLNPALKLGASTEVVLQAPVKGRSLRAYTGTVTLKRNERALLLLFPPLRPGTVEVQSRVLVDALPAAKPVAPGR